MTIAPLRFPIRILTNRLSYRRLVSQFLVMLITIFGLMLIGTSPALAGLNDDRFDGNIFALYGGNGSLVPPRISLAESLKVGKPALLVFYVDDSSDCKQYASTVSQLQAPYGRVANFIPISVDSLPLKSTFMSKEPGYYYKGLLPQTVLIDQKGKVVFNEAGQLPYERVDDAFRKVFDLLPRTESVELKRRTFNEINTELTNQ